VDLRNRGAGDRGAIERLEYLVDRLRVNALERRHHLVRRKRRDLVLQLGQLVGDVSRQEVAPRRQHLSELDEDRAQILQRQTKPHGARRRYIAPEGDRARGGPQPVKAFVSEQELVEPVFERDAQYLDEPERAHGADCKGSLANTAPGRDLPAREPLACEARSPV
jgi:hypothetical protein